MALVDICELWNKTESASAVPGSGGVGASEVGVNGAVGGSPTFPLCKFGNGIYCNASGEDAAFVLNSARLNKSIIEWWMKTDYNVVNGQPTDGHHYFFEIESSVSTETFAVLAYKIAALGLVSYAAGDGGNLGKNTIIDWSAGDLLHCMFVIDRSAGFDGAKTSALYINGAQVSSGTGALSDKGGATGAIVHFGSSTGGGFVSKATEDNPKIYTDVSAAIIAEIILNSYTNNNEGWPVAGGKRMIDSGIRSNLIDGSVLVA